MRSTIKHFKTVTIGTMIIALLNLQFVAVAHVSSAAFLDNEASVQNSFEAGTLNFDLQASDWNAPETSSSLKPGDLVSKTVLVKDLGNLGFTYTTRTAISSTDSSDLSFCNDLTLLANLNGGPAEFSGFLKNFVFGPVDYQASDSWQFDVGLPLYTSADTNNGAECSFSFAFGGLQTDASASEGLPGQGFHDSELADSAVQAMTIIASSDYSPIADSFVNEQNQNQNNGNDNELHVQAGKDGKAKRAFIRFQLNLPSQTHILDAKLRMFMKSAPNQSRVYNTTRAIGSNWSESTITWSNQPVLSASPTDSTITGVQDNAWLAWNTTADVQSFVNGTDANYGWAIKDQDELSSKTYQAVFHSRDSNNASKRPVLEMTFEVPQIITNHVVVNEVYYDVDSDKGNATNNEWLELYNPTSQSMAIANWKICDNGGCDTLPGATPALPSKGFAVISPNASTWTTFWPATPSQALRIALGSSIGSNGLANNGDRIILKNDLGVVIDTMSYGNDSSQLNPAIPLSQQGNSLARVIKGYDNDIATDWIINATPNPGTNPSQGGIEVMRLTDDGIEIASQEQGLSPLDTSDDTIQSSDVSDGTFEQQPINNQGTGNGQEITTSSASFELITGSSSFDTLAFASSSDAIDLGPLVDTASSSFTVASSSSTNASDNEPGFDASATLPKKDDELGQTDITAIQTQPSDSPDIQNQINNDLSEPTVSDTPNANE